MKVSDYIVNYLINLGIKDIFGYQGTMIAHFIDSVGKNQNIINHVCYNEQGAAFEAVGYAKSTGGIACAYSTSGPGATNLITGIADAYYDSVPVLFITGQLNTYEYSSVDKIRQQGFQEIDIVSIVKPITKYAIRIDNVNDIPYEFEKAYSIMTTGRKGPVLIDLPMNIQRENLNINNVNHYILSEVKEEINYKHIAKSIIDIISESKRPVLFLGNGLSQTNENIRKVRKIVNLLKIPTLYSMLGKSFLEENNEFNYGFMGAAYGQRWANIIGCKKTDTIISLGCRLTGRTIGLNKEKFNPNARIIRVEIDKEELKLPIHSNDINFFADVNVLIDYLIEEVESCNLQYKEEWNDICYEIKKRLINIDYENDYFLPNRFVSAINDYLDDDSLVFADVGQNQIWAAHSINIKNNQKILFSGGLGAMGFSLPASIGGCIANKVKTFAICGDGGIQMNIQELQLLKNENIPVTIVVFNNESLGLIHQQQCDFFNNEFYGSCAVGGYITPEFSAIADAYKIQSYSVTTIEEFKDCLSKYDCTKPCLIEIKLPIGTKAYPKTYFGNEMIKQKPELNEDLLNRLLSL